jgi:hypothetical protein
VYVIIERSFLGKFQEFLTISQEHFSAPKKSHITVIEIYCILLYIINTYRTPLPLSRRPRTLCPAAGIRGGARAGLHAIQEYSTTILATSSTATRRYWW